MAETTSSPLTPPRRFYFDWLAPTLLRPRAAFANINGASGDTWLTPIIILMLTGLGRVLATGWLKAQAALISGPVLPPGFENLPPDQQTQFFEAQAATSGPVFVYVFPAIMALLQVWLGWLIVTGVLHLVLTLLGGRGSTRGAMNIVAWASLPFAVRDLVRVGYMLYSQQLIGQAGLAGFAPTDGMLGAYLAQVLAQVDLYLFWHIFLLVLGIRAGDGLATGRVTGGAVITLLLIVLLGALPGFAVAQLSSLTIIQPFFF